jgi:hypothetical protein
VNIEFVHNSSFGVQIDLLTSVVIEPVFELHAASLNCTVQCSVESTEDQSCVSRSCVVSARGTATERHMVAILLIWMVFLSSMRDERCTLASIVLASIVLNPRRFEALLVDFDSDCSGVSILAADGHILVCDKLACNFFF